MRQTECFAPFSRIVVYRELKERLFGAKHVNWKWKFCVLWKWSGPSFRANRCLRADVSYFLCCTRKRDKGNRRRLHAGKANRRCEIKFKFVSFNIFNKGQRPTSG